MSPAQHLRCAHTEHPRQNMKRMSHTPAPLLARHRTGMLSRRQRRCRDPHTAPPPVTPNTPRLPPAAAMLTGQSGAALTTPSPLDRVARGPCPRNLRAMQHTMTTRTIITGEFDQPIFGRFDHEDTMAFSETETEPEIETGQKFTKDG